MVEAAGVEHSQATGRDACRLDGLSPVPVESVAAPR